MTVHDTLQYNGVAERLNQTILEKVCTMLHVSGLPKFLWGEAARHAVWLKNRTPTKVLARKTPYEAALGQTPNLSRLREWGSPVFVKMGAGTKLGGCIEHEKWMGIDEHTKNACRVYWPLKHTVTVECNVYFDTAPRAVEGEEECYDPSILFSFLCFLDSLMLRTLPRLPVSFPLCSFS